MEIKANHFLFQQYYFYTLDANNLTCSYEDAYVNINKLVNVIKDTTTKNKTIIAEEDIKMNSMQYKLEKLVDTVFNYRISSSDPSYRKFFDVNIKQFATFVYLTRVVSIVNKIATDISKLKANEDLKEEIKSVELQFRRRPDYFIAIHFDLITDVLWTNDEHYTLLDAVNKMCDADSNSTRRILIDGFNTRVKNVICSTRFKEIYSVVEREALNGDDIKNSRYSLLKLIKILQNGTDDIPVDVFAFFNER